MPVTVTWGDDARSWLYYTVSEPWLWDDFYAATTAGREMRICADVPAVSIVVDVQQARKIPADTLTQVNIMGRRDTLVGDHIQRIVIVGANAFLRSILAMVSRVAPRFGTRMVLVDSLTEAENILEADARQRAKNTHDAVPTP